MPFRVQVTEGFEEAFESLEKKEKEWVRKIIIQLKMNPLVGKPLGYEWVREKKFEGKRLYFLVYFEKEKVLLVAFGDKKEQKEIIRGIKENLDAFRLYVEKTNDSINE